MNYLKKIIVLSVVLIATSDVIGAVGGIIKEGKRKARKVYSIVGQADGSAKIIVKAGQPAQTLKKGTYRVLSMKVPKSTFKKGHTLLLKKQYAAAEKEAQTQYDTYKWLGHGAFPGVTLGKALLAQKKFSKAEAIYSENYKLNSSNKDLQIDISLGLAQSYAGQSKNKKLILFIPTLIKSGGAATAYAFNIQGDMAKKAKDNEGALLAYMKTFTLFSADDKSVTAYRVVAKKNIIELFTAMKDTRAKTFLNQK